MTDGWDDLDDEDETIEWVADVEGIPQDVISEDGPVEGQVGLFGDHDQFHVAHQQWEGMPEFIMQDLEPAFTCVVKFRTAEDRQAFAELVGQPLRGWRAGAGIWFPKIEIGSYADKRYRDASGETR